MATLTLIRGLPGSGKSTLAKMMVNGSMNPTRHYEADMFFMHGADYRFDHRLIGKAHEWCQASAKYGLECGDNVIVSNTFTTIKEMDPYLKMKSDKFQIIECKGDFGNIHNVPFAVIERMRDRWENI